MPIDVLIVTPAGRGSRAGNRITADRWARILVELGCRVHVADHYHGESPDLLIGLHARKSAGAIADFHKSYPDRPLLLALTGTDLYADLKTHATARRSLEFANRLIVLQPDALRYVPSKHRRRVRVIYQSSTPPRRVPKPRSDRFEICVVGHLRPVKDPFRAAMAARKLPARSRIQIRHIGRALTSEMEHRARREEARNARYEWLGELSPERTKQQMARSRLVVLSSRMEGGANVISEAIVAGVPVVASRISGSIGLLGADYPGFFDVGDTRALSELMLRTEEDPEYLEQLSRACAARKPLFSPEHERSSWRALLAEVLE